MPSEADLQRAQAWLRYMRGQLRNEPEEAPVPQSDVAENELDFDDDPQF